MLEDCSPKVGHSALLLCLVALGCGSGPSQAGGRRSASGGSAGSGATGGSSADGGRGATGGSAGAPTPVVMPCPSLADSSAQIWERITPPGDLGDSQCVRVHPTEAGTVFVMMHKGGNGAHAPTDGLYKSTDCGATWGPKINVGENGDTVASGSWWSFVIDPTDPDVIYTIDGYGAGGVWKSVNGGIDWVQTIPDEQGQYIPSLFLNGLMMDPTDHLHLVATVHITCTGPAEGGCLPETFDGGATWHLLKGPDTGWAEGAGPIIVDKEHLLYATGFGGLSLTTDDGKSWKKVAGSAYPSLYTAPDGTYYVTSNNGGMASTDLVEWTQIPGAGRVVPIAGDDTHFYTADQWSGNYFSADAANPTEMQKLTNAGIPESAQGAPFLAYDGTHGVLYSSNFGGGLWRLVTP